MVRVISDKMSTACVLIFIRPIRNGLLFTFIRKHIGKLHHEGSSVYIDYYYGIYFFKFGVSLDG